MKKLLSLALALVICLGLTVPALAINVPGDTDVSDSKGNIFQLSSPILYSFPLESARAGIDWESESLTVTSEIIGLDNRNTMCTGQNAIDFINRNLWSGSDIVYAVPSGTNIYFPNNYFLSSATGIDVFKKDGSYYSDTAYFFEATADFDNVYFTADDDAGFLVRIIVNGWKNGDDGRGVNLGQLNIAFYFTSNPSAPNPFENVETPAPSETPAEPETPAAPETPASGAAFADVAADAFYAEPVAWAVENNITKGTSATTFSPNGTCKIEQILTFLWRAAGSPESTAPCPFAGLDQSSPYYPALCWASEKGILKDEASAAGKDCTRIMAVQFMFRYAGSPESTTKVGFLDVPGGQMPAVLWALDNGVTNGTGNGNFSPEKTCSRGEIVTFLFRAFSEK